MVEYSIIFQPNSFHADLPAYEDGTECSETSTYKIHTPGNYPEENTKSAGQLLMEV
jgi:hypothetical protein